MSQADYQRKLQKRPRGFHGPLPRYPRFPNLLPRSRRGPSVFRVVYLGTHPVALILSAVIWCALIEVWLLVALLAVTWWLLLCSAVAVRRAAAKRR